MWKIRITAVLIIILGFLVGFFVYKSEMNHTKPFRLGLDLSGGSHLIYRADVSQLKNESVTDAMSSLRDVIERRVNLFGVSEPQVTVENPGFTNQGENRLIVDLPGVTDINKAVTMIGQTPLLEFRTENGNAQIEYVPTQLTGRYLDHAALQFDQNNQSTVSLVFDAEGSKLFEQITRDNIGKTVAIFLDGQPISTPRVNEAISGGQAQITGNFTPTEAKQLVGRLNSGALPVPIELISTQTIGASLGVAAVHNGVRAGIIGFIAIALFLFLWYRLPGIIAIVALTFYVAIVLALFKLFGVTLSSAGIAGFIVSLGIAVDANVLIFERIKEEIKNGHALADAIKAGFTRAWTSIRDSNLSTLITAVILFWFGTSLIKGFALTLGIGVLASMLSAVVVSRVFLLSLNITKTNKVVRFLFGSGFTNANTNK